MFCLLRHFKSIMKSTTVKTPEPVMTQGSLSMSTCMVEKYLPKNICRSIFHVKIYWMISSVKLEICINMYRNTVSEQIGCANRMTLKLGDQSQKRTTWNALVEGGGGGLSTSVSKALWLPDTSLSSCFPHPFLLWSQLSMLENFAVGGKSGVLRDSGEPATSCCVP